MPTLQDLLQKADSYKQKISSARPLAKEELKSLDDYFRIGFTYSSNALEGNTLTISETKILLEDGITVGGRPLKDCYEAVGHGAAYDFMLELARQQDMCITEDTIKKLHRLFYQKVDDNQAGQYRSVQVYISGTEYIPPAPDEIPQLMKHLTDQIRSSRGTLHPIELAAMAHKRLVDIHPFIDGNGRTGRLLVNLELMKAGYPPIDIKFADRNSYYNAFDEYYVKHNLGAMEKLFASYVNARLDSYLMMLEKL